LVLFCLIAAIASGLVEGVVSRYISLLLIFPMVLGLIIGAVAMRIIERSHIRAPLVAAVIAGSCGLFAQATLHGAQYYQFRVDLRGQFEQRPELAGMLDSVVDSAIEQETGHRGMVGYLMLRSKLGTELKRSGSSTAGPKLQGLAFWILFGLNFLIVIGIAAMMAADRARAVYCEGCQRWYDRTQPVARGSTEKSAVLATRQALERGDYSEVPKTLGDATQQATSVVQLLRCSNCTSHEPQLSYTVITGIGKKQNTKKILTTLLRPEEAKLLTGAFAKKS
jgi:hypothetical protein